MNAKPQPEFNSKLKFNNTYAEAFPDLGSPVSPTPLIDPQWVHISQDVCDILNMPAENVASTITSTGSLDLIKQNIASP